MIKYVCDFCFEEISYNRQQFQVEVRDSTDRFTLGRAKFDICPRCIKAHTECHIDMSIVLTINSYKLQADQDVELDLTRLIENTDRDIDDEL